MNAIINSARWSPDAPTTITHTALHDAAAVGDLEAAERLIAGGADVNAATLGGLTPLHIVALIYSRTRQAARYDRARLAQLDALARALIAAGADARQRCAAGYIPGALADGFQPPSLAAETARLALSGAWPTEVIDDQGRAARGGAGSPRRVRRHSSTRSTTCTQPQY